MVFPIVGGTQSTGYDISNSLKFNDDDSSLLSRAFSTNPSDQKLTTISFWFKIGNITSSFRSLYRFNDGSNTGAIYLRNGNDLQFAWDVSSGTLDVRPNGVFRDPTAWYHCHIKVDTTQGTAANRVIIHINGVERTYGTATYPDQNATLEHLSNGETYYIGGDGQSSDKYFDGYITEFNVIDGQAKDYTDFGEFNDNGVWIPKKYTGTYGNNGFFLEFQQTGTSQNSSGIGADTSGNDLHWAVANLDATDSVEDTCTNNFATFNPLFRSRFDNDGTFLEGNCQRDFTDNANRGYGMSTLGVTSGKWYWEIKVIGSDVSRIGIGVGYDGLSAFTDPFYDNNPSLGMHFYSSGSVSANGSTQSYGSSASANDIFMYALDMDNHLIWLGKNGSWFNSATVTEIQNSTATNDITTKLSSQTFLNSGEPVFPMVNDLSTTGASQFQINFGNPPFSISSGNNDGEYGNFEYAPPSGYYALCTKRLAEFG